MSIPVCATCKTLFKIKKNEFIVRTDPGTVKHGDLWGCPKCGTEIVIGFGIPLCYETYYDQDGIDLEAEQ